MTSSTRQNSLALVVLLLLLGVTVAMAYLDIGVWHTPAAMLIAVAKAVLILLLFMNLRRERGVILLAAATGFFWLAIMISLTLSDYLTRG